MTNLVQIRYLGSSCKYLEPVIFSFSPTPKIKGSSHAKKNKILIFSKCALTILIQFCGFIEHSKPNNMTLSVFPEKIPEIRKIVSNFLFVA